jgi:PAS domain S-box-containing protein
MLEALPVALYMTDAQGRLTFFNAAAVKLSGRVPEIGTDLTWKIFLSDGTPLPHDQCPMAIALKGAEVPTGIECIAERPDGSRFWFTRCPAVVHDAEGRIIGGINLLMDITDRKHAEIEANEQFRAIVETTPECVKIVAPDGTLLFMNTPGLAMVGASAGDAVIGRNVYDIIALEDRNRFREFNERICKGEKASLQFDIVGLKGARRHMETHAAPLRHLDGTIVHLAVTHDITERKRAEGAAFLLSAIVDSSDDAIISKNLDGVITSWNKSAERLFGYTAAEAIGKTVAALLIPSDRQEEEPDILARLRRGERVDHFETVRRRKDGSLIDISLTISPVKDPQGTIVGASKVARDISDRKLANRANLLLGAIVDSSDDAIISKNLDGVITSWNKSAERLFGYTPEEAIGQTVAALLIPPDRLAEEPDILARLRRGERVDHFETVRRRKDGSLIDISLTISPVKDQQGRIIGASKVARDITERKKFEKRLVEQAQLLDLSSDAILVRDGEDLIVDWNRAAEKMYGFTREEALGKISHELLQTEFPEPLPGIREILLRDGRWSGELIHISRAGSRIITLSRWVAEQDKKGDVIRILESNNDITERVRVQDDLRRANEDLEQFAFSATHDLQEPLRSVKIYSELLATRHGGTVDEEAQKFITFVRNGATRMELLIRDLLTYTQVTKFDPASETADANEALNGALANLGGAISESGAKISADPLPSLPVHGMHLQQVFQNLIGNAIKYRSPDRPPAVCITAEREDGYWIFAVSDNGIGIESEYKERIFGLFKRLHTSEEYSGTGIGLAICQRIVDRYHGRIWVESEPGRGSTFRFVLPV